MENQSNQRQLYTAFGPGHPLHGLHAKRDQAKPKPKKGEKPKTEKSVRSSRAKKYGLIALALPVIAYLGYKAVAAALELF